MNEKQAQELLDAAEKIEALYDRVKYLAASSRALIALAEKCMKNEARDVCVEIKYRRTDQRGIDCELVVETLGSSVHVLQALSLAIDDACHDARMELKDIAVPVICQPTPDEATT